MVAQAIDCLEDVPVQKKGHAFLQNSWGQGPFYSWNPNYAGEI